MSYNLIQVKDAETKAPLPDVQVKLEGWVFWISANKTDAAGTIATVAIPLFTYKLTLTKDRYQPKTVSITVLLPVHFIEIMLSR